MIFFSFLQLYILNIRLKLIVFFEYVGFWLVICTKKESNLYRLSIYLQVSYTAT